MQDYKSQCADVTISATWLTSRHTHTQTSSDQLIWICGKCTLSTTHKKTN